MFRLEIKGLGPFRYEKIVETKNMFVEVREPTATGKTTIARILYSFLSGHVDTSLLSQGVEEGYAKLVLASNKEYILTIKPNFVNVNKVLDEAYSEYLVLTEGTPLYSFYVSPPKVIDVEELVKRFVPTPPELSKLEAELKKIEPKFFDAEKLISTYQASLDEEQKELKRLEAELKKIEEELANIVDVNKVKPVLEKQKLQDQMKVIENEIKRMQEEYTNLLLGIQGVNYDELKLRHKELADSVERLYRRRDMVDSVINSLEKIKEALMSIRSTVDILIEYNIPLFGQLVDPQSVEIWISDIDAGIETLASKRAEIRAEISKLEQEKSKIEAVLEDFVIKHQRISDLESMIARRKRELEDIKIKLSSTERQVKELEKQLGMSEDEILKKAIESRNADRLVTRKRELERQIEEVKRLIKDLESSIEKVKQKQEEAVESRKQYEEMKKQYSSLRNEWNEKKRIFRDTFREAYKEVFRNITIPDFDPENMVIQRPAHTYSQGERLLMTIAFQYALISALKAVGYNIPMIVIDLIVPIDERYESEIKRVLKNLDTFRMILKTTNESGIVAIS